MLAARLAEEAEGSERELDFRAIRSLTQAMLERYAGVAGAPFPADPMVQLAQAVVRYSVPGTRRRRRPIVGSGAGPTRRASISISTCFAELEAVGAKLEAEFRDVQDFEFTVEDGRLYLLQTRSAQRTAWAVLRTAVDMVAQGLIAPEEALRRLADIDLAGIARSHFAEPLPEALAQAAVAGHGVASGAVALDAASVQRLAAKGQPVLLVRPDAVTADIPAPKNTAYWSGGGTRSNPDEWLTSDTLPSHTAASCGAY